MSIISSSRTIVCTCKLCGQDKPHASLGICIASVCVDCTNTLPPIPPGQKRCPSCLELHESKHAYCKPCLSQYRKDRYNPEQKRDANLRTMYGLSLEKYELMLFQQCGLCAICQKPESIIDPYTKQPKALVVDHDHISGNPRQLLCHYCNILLGLVENDPARMKAILRYHKKHVRSA